MFLTKTAKLIILFITQVLEFLLNDCDITLEYRDCGAVVGISEIDKHLVIAVRGTYENAQAIEQVLTGLTGKENFLTGGKVSV